MRLVGLILLSLVAVTAAPAAVELRAPAAQPAKEAVAVGTGGAAASVDPDATQAAIDVLREGGNAVDAAMAANATLGVTEPYVAGIGGGGFMVVYLARQHRVVTIDGRETAPQAFPEDAFIDPATGQPIPFSPQRVTSGMAVGVPGTLATWAEAAQRFGTMPLARLLQPAITRRRAAASSSTRPSTTRPSRTAPRLDAFTSSRALFLTRTARRRPSAATSATRDLAQTYRLIAHDGPRALLRRADRRGARRHGRQHPPLAPDSQLGFTVPPGRDDARPTSANYTAPLRAPDARDLPRARRLRDGPALERRLDRRRGAQHPRGLRHVDGPTARSRCTATSRRRGSRSPTATAGSATPTTSTCRSRGLLSNGLRRRAPLPDRRHRRDEPGRARRPVPAVRHRAAPPARRRGRPGRGNVDEPPHRRRPRRQRRRATRARSSRSPAARSPSPATGFLLNNELTDFDSGAAPRRRARPEPAAPAASGRARAWRRRSCSGTASPCFAVGSPGGATIITTVLQILLNRIDFGMSLPDAIAAPRASQRNAATTRPSRRSSRRTATC